MDKYNEWLNSEFIDENDKNILKNMNLNEINESFYKDLEFGTAGIRGIMGLGTNRINKYTISKTTVGLANYLNKKYDNSSVVIAYDTRNNSKEYAFLSANILNYYGIKTYIFDCVTSTPELSFAVKYLNCNSGIVITSSHNSKIYNGYKIYNESAGQITPLEAKLISEEINNASINKKLLNEAKNSELFNYCSKDVHEAFILENEKALINKNLINEYSKDVTVTYSSFHGVGLKTAKELFDKYNIKYNIVNEQCTYDGNFPLCEEPNPEYINNYDYAIKYAKENNSDIILVTDPDADRVGVMIKNNDEYKYLTGNELGILFTHYVINNSTIKDNSFIVRSIVSTPYVDLLAKNKNINIYEVLTGCKNIANKKVELTNKGYNYLFGFEESLGYMFNIDVNDKNGFSSMLVMIEILCYCKKNNISINDYLNNIYREYGKNYTYTLNTVIDKINYETIIKNIMNDFRNDKITFNDIKYVVDYSKEEINNTNALKYVFNNNSSIMVRPSGTEPKIKFYISSPNKNFINESIENIDKIMKMY